jgi:signal transduction histidine kinase
VGGVRGAISVTLPLGKIFAEAKANSNLMFGSMLLLVIMLSSTLLFFLRRMVLAPLNQLALSIHHFSEKNPPPQAIVRSGDEFEELSRAFEEMAANLSSYQHGLEDKVSTATAELQHLNQQIRDASERKSEFLARAAHELRTPLTSIRGAMEYITARMKQTASLNTNAQPEDLIEFFEIIQKNTERLIRMVQTMLDIEYIEAGAERTLNLSRIDLTHVIQECVQSFTFDAERYCLDLCSLPTDLPPVYADEDRVRQVLTNLLGNAVKFAREHSAITVCAGQKGDMVQVKICNQGPTIPAEQRDLVFSRFYRSGDKAGTGLGLAICRAIVEAHGGSISISDPDQGSGVCVFFTLPVRNNVEEQS